MCYIVGMKKNFLLFGLTILLLETLSVTSVSAHLGHEGGHEVAEVEETARMGRTTPAVAPVGEPATMPAVAPDMMVRPLIDDGNKMMILPYTSSVMPASFSARPVLRRVTEQMQERRDQRQEERSERRKAREEQLGNLSRSKRVEERMGDVAKRVKEILEEREAKGGIGELVREVAREQSESHATLSARLAKIKSRPGAVRWLLGHDRQNLMDLKKDATAIDQRIAKIEAGLDSMSEEERETALDLVEDLKTQRTELLATVEEKDSEFSVVGWFKKLFGQNN